MLTTAEKIQICLKRCKELINRSDVMLSEEDKDILKYIPDINDILDKTIQIENKNNESIMLDSLKQLSMKK